MAIKLMLLGDWVGPAERETIRDAQRNLARDDLSDYVQARAARTMVRKPRTQETMIDHVSIAVSDLSRSTRFYEAVLGAIGYTAIDVRGSTVGFGKKYSEFWLNARPEMAPIPPRSGAHICLRVRSTELVDAFHAAALAHGGASDGAPGLRPHDGEGGYYAAFIRDLDGNRVEAVTFIPAG